jgi:carbohydrate-selective porin OprB
MPVFWGAGLSYEGLVPARKTDVVSAGLVSGKVSKFIPDASVERLLEVNYQWRHSRFLIVTPHFEYITNPSGFQRPSAAVAGVQLALTF